MTLRRAHESSGRWIRGKGSGEDTGQRKWENRDENGVEDDDMGSGRGGLGTERQRGNRQQVNWNKCRQT